MKKKRRPRNPVSDYKLFKIHTTKCNMADRHSVCDRYPDLCDRYPDRIEVLNRLDRKGVLKHVVEYRNLRDELSSKLDQMQKEGSNVEDQRRRYGEIKDKAPLLAPEIRKPGPRKFIEDLEGYIRDLKRIKSELEEQERIIKIKNWINEEIRKIKEFLGELEM